MGLVAAALIGVYYSVRVDEVTKLGDPQKLFAFKDTAWRSIFWVSLPPGILFVVGGFFVAESPRWLYRGGRKEAARKALLYSRTEAQAQIELNEMEETIAAERAKVSTSGETIKESLLSRKYVVPFLMACVILACNQATGVNSIIGYNTTILIQAGLSDEHAHMASLTFNFVNFLATIGAVLLVDRKGRKFLLSLGTAGIIVSLVCTGLVFEQTEKQRVDVKTAMQALVTPDQKLDLTFNQQIADKLLATGGAAGTAASGKPATLVVIYSCGDYVAASQVVRSDDLAPKLEITRDSCLPSSKVDSFFKNPFADFAGAANAPLKIENALITPIPSESSGWLTATCLFVFMAFFAVGPGVCVWLALSELMPTRIRSNGMSIALMINIAVSTTIAAVFLPSVGKYGYSTMFFVFAGCTVVYFITAAFILPETKGKTLEEIEEHFEGKKS
jgi:MFS family permease